MTELLYSKSDTINQLNQPIHLPILLKYSANRYNNIRPYILGGFSTSFNLSSNQNSPMTIVMELSN